MAMFDSAKKYLGSAGQYVAGTAKGAAKMAMLDPAMTGNMLTGGLLGGPLAMAKLSGSFSGNAQAAPMKNKGTVVTTNKQQTSSQEFDPLGAIGGLFGGIGKYISERPELMTGLLTGAIGAGAGMDVGEAFGTGGMVTQNMLDKNRAELLERQKLLASMAGTNINVTDTNKQLEQELSMYGIKDPAKRAEYIQARSQGLTPVYNPGFAGIGKGISYQ